MKLSSLSSSSLKKLVKLIAQREKLEAQRLQLETQIDTIAGETARIPAKTHKVTASPRKAKKRGKLKAAILSALTQADKAGLTVSELSSRIQVKPANLFVWFYTTGRKVKGLKKAGKKYIYKG